MAHVQESLENIIETCPVYKHTSPDGRKGKVSMKLKLTNYSIMDLAAPSTEQHIAHLRNHF